MRLYFEQKNKLTQKEKNETKKTISMIIKTNSDANVKDLNLALIRLLVIDHEYKEKILAKLYDAGKPPPPPPPTGTLICDSSDTSNSSEDDSLSS